MKRILKRILLALAAQAPIASFAQRAGPANTVLRVPSSGGRAKFGLLGAENFNTRTLTGASASVNNIATVQTTTIPVFNAGSTQTISSVTVTGKKNPVMVIGTIEYIDCNGPAARLDATLTRGPSNTQIGNTISFECATAGGAGAGGTIVGISPLDSPDAPTAYNLRLFMTGISTATIYNPSVTAFELH